LLSLTRAFTVITQYWLVAGTDLSVIYISRNTCSTKLNELINNGHLSKQQLRTEYM